MDNKEPLVSIITAAFNGADFLEKFSVPSVLGQSYENWELIIVDDGSTDGTESIIERFRKMDRRVKYIKHDSNRGLAAAMNSGIKIAKGELVAFLEQDDAWLPRKLERQVGAMKKDTDALCSTVLFWELDVKKQKICNISMAMFSGVMMYRRVFEEIGLFDEEKKLSGMQDADLVAKLALRYGTKGRNYFLHLEEPLIVFTRHGDSLSSRYNGGPRKFVDRYTAICEKYDRPEFLGGEAIRQELSFWYSHLGLNLLLLGDEQLAKKNLVRSLRFKNAASVRMMVILSYLPKRISRLSYIAANEIKNISDGVKVSRAMLKYEHEYAEAWALIKSSGLGRS